MQDNNADCIDCVVKRHAPHPKLGKLCGLIVDENLQGTFSQSLGSLPAKVTWR